MFKLYASLFVLTLSMSSTLAFPKLHPENHPRNVGDPVSRRGDPLDLDARDVYYGDLEARDLFEEPDLGSSSYDCCCSDLDSSEDDDSKEPEPQDLSTSRFIIMERDFDPEELWGRREYEDFLVERDAFDDLD